MHEVLVNHLGGLSLARKSVVMLTDRPDMTLDVYRGRKTTIQQQQLIKCEEFLHGKSSLFKNVRTLGLLCTRRLNIMLTNYFLLSGNCFEQLGPGPCISVSLSIP